MHFFDSISGCGHHSGWFGRIGAHSGDAVQVVVLGLTIFLLLKMLKNTMQPMATSDEILKQRFASGEIDNDTYRNMKEQLK